ncbi:MAG: Rossmann-like and DUF2520 domain-containing protein [Ktedonobacterales bacterium]
MATHDAADSLSFKSIGFVGAGAVGSTLVRALVESGVKIRAVAAKNLAHAKALVERLPTGMAQALSPAEVVQSCDLVFLAVSDDMIEPLAKSLPWHSGQSAVHLSGAKSSAALAASRDMGAQVAALHPLMTFPRAELERPALQLLGRLRGCYWALDTEEPTLAEQLQRLVGILRGHLLKLSVESRIPYHIGAVFASNYVVALVGAACALFETLGMGQGESLSALLPLVRASVDSMAELGIPQALSGPVARGDAGTVATHLDWLQHFRQVSLSGSEVPTSATSLAAQMESATEAYRALAQVALLLAAEKQTITQEQIAAIRALLETP